MAKPLLNITMRWLQGDELDVLTPIIKARNWQPLNKFLWRALAAYDEKNQLVGFYVLKLLPHPEPLFVEPPWRGSGVAEALADEMYKILKDTPSGGVWFTAENPVSAKMAEERGLVKVEYPVYTNGAQTEQTIARLDRESALESRAKLRRICGLPEESNGA